LGGVTVGGCDGLGEAFNAEECAVSSLTEYEVGNVLWRENQQKKLKDPKGKKWKVHIHPVGFTSQRASHSLEKLQ